MENPLLTPFDFGLDIVYCAERRFPCLECCFPDLAEASWRISSILVCTDHSNLHKDFEKVLNSWLRTCFSNGLTNSMVHSTYQYRQGYGGVFMVSPQLDPTSKASDTPFTLVGHTLQFATDKMVTWRLRSPRWEICRKIMRNLSKPSPDDPCMEYLATWKPHKWPKCR